MSNEIQITTQGGERWDNIAVSAYGDPAKMNAILAANPGVPPYDILPEGIVINIPIIEAAEVKTNAEQLPPWKR
ncbi:tail protein X [Arachidicoccus terrestris]|uniref:tail protein X n=1 Tax=Arachidicoccus terrestris TaxID=2875539 RepID=UPI001CC4E8FC|nr:tail protein X [Arachidicoccus terrestris]UAY56268.1 tail protein X [Arachidicoccus terrestris]